MAAIGLDIDVRRPTNEFDFSIRQAIEVARACLVPQEVLGIAFPVVLLDEPTAALQKTEEEAFFRLIRRVREHGSLLFVSHRLTEVLAVSDMICVLKDGHLVASVGPRRTNESMLRGDRRTASVGLIHSLFWPLAPCAGQWYRLCRISALLWSAAGMHR